MYTRPRFTLSHATLRTACLGGLLTLGSTLAAATPETVVSSAPEAGQAHYAPGAVTQVRQVVAGRGGDIEPGEVLGVFVNTENPFRLDRHRQINALGFIQGDVGYTAEGWLEARTPGRYVFIGEVAMPPVELYQRPERWQRKKFGNLTCEVSLFVENHQVLNFTVRSERRYAEKVERGCGYVRQAAGGVDLAEGVYRVAMHFACKGRRRGVSTRPKTYAYPKGCPVGRSHFQADANPSDEATFGLRLKRPEQNVPTYLQPNELVHLVEAGS